MSEIKTIEQLERELNEAKLNIENADENFREICILCGFDPSDGEGTSYEQVVGAVKRTADQLRAELEKVRGGIEKHLGEAMQDVWNDHGADTGCFPTCFHTVNYKAKISAQFIGSSFAFEVSKLLLLRITELEKSK